MQITKFGFLPEALSVDFSTWKINTLDSFDHDLEVWESIATDLNWVYPPITHKVQQEYEPESKKLIEKKIDGSEKEFVIWSAPASHELVYTGKYRGWF